MYRSLEKARQSTDTRIFMNVVRAAFFCSCLPYFYVNCAFSADRFMVHSQQSWMLVSEARYRHQSLNDLPRLSCSMLMITNQKKRQMGNFGKFVAKLEHVNEQIYLNINARCFVRGSHAICVSSGHLLWCCSPDSGKP